MPDIFCILQDHSRNVYEEVCCLRQYSTTFSAFSQPFESRIAFWLLLRHNNEIASSLSLVLFIYWIIVSSIWRRI